MRVSLCVFAVLALASMASAFTTLQVDSPSELKEGFYDGLVADRPAMFGIPSYESSIQGPVYIAEPYDACTELSPLAGSDKITRIVMVQRGGGCTFVTKVRNAENAGAKAVIVSDDNSELYLPYMADDGTGANLVTPSVLIHQNDGDKIKEAAQEKTVVVTLSWSLPKAEHVTYRLYFLGNTRPETRKFLEEFAPVDAKLGKTATFIPEYIMRNKWWGLSGVDCFSDEEDFCDYDPVPEHSTLPNGGDVIRANLYSKCLYYELEAAGKSNKWFDFINAYNKGCVPMAMEDLACREEALSTAGLGKYKKSTSISDCEAKEDDDLGNWVLRNMTNQEFVDSVGYISPSLYINGARYSGSLSCPSPISLTTCGPLEAICAAYVDGFEPSICKGSSGSSSGGGGVSAGLVVFIVILAVGAFAAAGYVYIRKQRQDMRLDLDNILSSYMNIDDANAMRSHAEPMIPTGTSSETYDN